MDTSADNRVAPHTAAARTMARASGLAAAAAPARCAWLLLAALWLSSVATTTQAQPSPPLAPTGDETPPAIKTKAKRVVCVSYYNPVTRCSGDDDSQVWG